jgi:hypothetical protein
MVFVTHGAGGILVQTMLLRRREQLIKVSAIVNYGVPFNGSSLASIAQMFGFFNHDGALQAMAPNDDLSRLEQDWLSARPDVKMYCAYETVPEMGKMVVDRASATATCNQVVAPINKNHEELVKPCSTDDPSYLVLKNAVASLTQ